MKQNTRFRHESLQDCESVERLLGALISGIKEGRIELEDEDGTMIMEPSGLANLKISASQDDERSRVYIRLTWYGDRPTVQKKEIRINHKGS